jgi:hypothetical protein
MAGGRGLYLALALGLSVSRLPAQIGKEVAVPIHLRDGEEFITSLRRLLNFGEALFTANWTVQERRSQLGKGQFLLHGVLRLEAAHIIYGILWLPAYHNGENYSCKILTNTLTFAG